MMVAGMPLLQAWASANIPSVNNRYALAAVVVAAAAVMVLGIFFVFRSPSFLLPLSKLSTPPELRTAKVILGKELFSKSAYFQDPSLGVITDIEKSADGQLVVVGQASLAYLQALFSVADHGVPMLSCSIGTVSWCGRTVRGRRVSTMRLQARSPAQKR